MVRVLPTGKETAGADRVAAIGRLVQAEKARPIEELIEEARRWRDPTDREGWFTHAFQRSGECLHVRGSASLTWPGARAGGQPQTRPATRADRKARRLALQVCRSGR